jgi:hypothetical protein
VGADAEVLLDGQLLEDPTTLQDVLDAAGGESRGREVADRLTVERDDIARSSEDLPAPLAPSSATIDPSGTSRETPRRARTTSS